MIKTIPPATWDGYQQITPEMLNRNILAAKAQLEEEAKKRWRAFDIPIAPTSNTFICKLPDTKKMQYVIDRISVSGTYTGQPSISFYREDDSTAETFLLPADGFEGEEYSNVIFTGRLMDGYAGTITDLDNNYTILATPATPNLQYTVSCRSCRPYLVDDQTMPAISLYKDEDVLTAARFNSDIDIIETFATQINPNVNNPAYFSRVCFENFTDSTAQILTTDRLPGSRVLNTTRWNQICAIIEVDGTPVLGQTLTLEWGRSDTFTGSAAIPIDSIIKYATDISFSDFSRHPSSTGDDFLVRVTNSVGGTAIKKVEIYVVSYEST